MRRDCIENGINTIDLSDGDYDWRLLLKNQLNLNTKHIIGPGITGIAFRLLRTVDSNYEPGGPAHQGGDEGRRHAFVITSANGDMWHINFHHRCERQELDHFPFDNEPDDLEDISVTRDHFW